MKTRYYILIGSIGLLSLFSACNLTTDNKESASAPMMMVMNKETIEIKKSNYIATKATYDRILRANETEGAVARDAVDQIVAKRLADEAQLESAKSVSFVAKSIPQTIFSGKIVRKSGALDTKLRTEHIEIDIKNEEKLLLPRMIVDASISLTAKESTFFIPKSALWIVMLAFM